ncbi:MAG TPA: O-acetyl-ADP-ribose deacetylase [Tahibacter sp.]|uniref:O-acetyl-ADP-ribose deacetylase n=1 Tax=Tahibacter sp. TaxID=2056211 RepID=UPI002B9974A4|nr:O-acetyl-ADP-ribose deacetylase [Tahibacter sp.]HSX58601.1 O-acetyl-ADP-ribose deacetylase [Tahibacter sp.]
MQVVIEAIEADITTLALDAIVNAANESLSGGGGVDGAIHRAAGPGLRDECAAMPMVRPHVRCPTGEAVLTGGHRLPARHIIHTVGPVWYGGDKGEPALLASCYRRCLALAREHDFASVAFPAISCGVFGYPLAEAVAIAVAEARAIADEPGSLSRIVFCCFGPKALQAYRDALAA